MSTMTNNHDPLHSAHSQQQQNPTTIKKRKASDAGVGPSTGAGAGTAGSHPLGGNSGFGYQAISSTTPLQPPKLKAIKKRKIKENSSSTTSGHPEGSSSARPGASKRERSTREFTPTDEELSEVNDNDNDDDDDDDDDGEGRGPVTGHKLSEAYRRLQSRRGESKEGSEAEGGGSQQGGGKKSKRNRVHFSCVEVSFGCVRQCSSCTLIVILYFGDGILVWIVSSVSFSARNVYLVSSVTLY
jgi:hypothetical protein